MKKDPDSEALEKRLWAAADQLRANSGLTSQQNSQPVLGLMCLRFAEVRFTARRSDLEKAASSSHAIKRSEAIPCRLGPKAKKKPPRPKRGKVL